jgi:programmed cell death 6-interacting protein
MSTNILSVPFRRTKPIPLPEKLSEFISSALDQHPEQFRDDIAELAKLRAEIVLIDIHPSSLERLVHYHAQLLAVSTKLPVDVQTYCFKLKTGRYRFHLVSQSKCGCSHPQYHAYSFRADKTVSQANLLYERLSVLYDIAALYSQLATAQSRTTADSLKRACQYFQNAAGTFEHLSHQTNDLRLPPGVVIDDFSESTINSLKFLMLAQAQECFWQKAVLGTLFLGPKTYFRSHERRSHSAISSASIRLLRSSITSWNE